MDIKAKPITPRIIVHGGAGNISRDNLPRESYEAYRKALLGIVKEANDLLSEPGATALDVATHAVTLLENNALFNSGRGAVYTRDGTHELEASVMVSRGYRKRGVGVMKVTRAKNPVLLAKEMLIQGQRDDGGGAQGHCQLVGETCDALAKQWGLEIVPPSYFWTRKRWDEHRRSLGKSHDDETYEHHRRQADGDVFDSETLARMEAVQDRSDEEYMHTGAENWNGKEYLPQGTVGCVVLDSSGTTCAATSTGGLTNKLPGRVGDTPTLGAGFWAEEWQSTRVKAAKVDSQQQTSSSLAAWVSDCIPGLSGYMNLPSQPAYNTEPSVTHATRAVAMSGTGNGDSFLRLSAVRTAAAMARFSASSKLGSGNLPLQDAVTAVAGPHGMLQQSAEDRWHKTGEGEGGIIGVDLHNGKGSVVADFNCGGMFRAWIDDEGQAQMAVFSEKY